MGVHWAQAGKLVDKLEGADASQLAAKVEQHIKLGAPMAAQPPAASTSAAAPASDPSLLAAAALRPDPTSSSPSQPASSSVS